MVHLRRGETLRRYLQPGLEDGKTFVFWGRNYNTGGIPGPERAPHLGQPAREDVRLARRAPATSPARPATATPSTPTAPTSPAATTARASSTEDDTARHLRVLHALHHRRDAAQRQAVGHLRAGLHATAWCCTARPTAPVAVSIDQGKTWQDCGTFARRPRPDRPRQGPPAVLAALRLPAPRPTGAAPA